MLSMSRIELKVVRLSSSSLCDEVLNDLLNYPKTSPPTCPPRPRKVHLSNEGASSIKQRLMDEYGLPVQHYSHIIIIFNDNWPIEFSART